LRTLSTDPAVVDTLTITHVPTAPELVQAEPGTELRWSNLDADHHLTVVKGSCRVLGRRLGAGGSVYVPAGMHHSLEAGVWGCAFFSVISF
jgi:quercetin dioxygenase-like cupin family protein